MDFDIEQLLIPAGKPCADWASGRAAPSQERLAPRARNRAEPPCDDGFRFLCDDFPQLDLLFDAEVSSDGGEATDKYVENF
jgi:hypothetical protein